jgi:hypothetical protein
VSKACPLTTQAHLARHGLRRLLRGQSGQSGTKACPQVEGDMARDQAPPHCIDWLLQCVPSVLTGRRIKVSKQSTPMTFSFVPFRLNFFPHRHKQDHQHQSVQASSSKLSADFRLCSPVTVVRLVAQALRTPHSDPTGSQRPTLRQTQWICRPDCT